MLDYRKISHINSYINNIIAAVFFSAISMNTNVFSADGQKPLGDMYINTVTSAVLMFQRNQIGDVGATALASNRTLNTLRLANNYQISKRARAASAQMAKNEVMTNLLVDERSSWLMMDAAQASSENPRFKKVGQQHKGERKQMAAIVQRPAIPPVVQGYETIYQRFLKGILIYRPQEESDVGRIDMPIAALTNPLEGIFDLSQCGDIGKYLSISTGYRKAKKAENANKVEIWIAPRFLIQKELATTAGHFREIEGKWAKDALVGIFWTWGGWKNLSGYDYLTSQNMENLSKSNLYGNWQKSIAGSARWRVAALLYDGKKFHLCFT